VIAERGSLVLPEGGLRRGLQKVVATVARGGVALREGGLRGGLHKAPTIAARGGQGIPEGALRRGLQSYIHSVREHWEGAHQSAQSLYTMPERYGSQRKRKKVR
jgi:hypothetical protein